MTFYSNDLGIETVWNCLESGLKKRINCKVLGQTGSLAEFSHGILEKLNGNSRIRRIRLNCIILF